MPHQGHNDTAGTYVLENAGTPLLGRRCWLVMYQKQVLLLADFVGGAGGGRVVDCGRAVVAGEIA